MKDYPRINVEYRVFDFAVRFLIERSKISVDFLYVFRGSFIWISDGMYSLLIWTPKSQFMLCRLMQRRFWRLFYLLASHLLSALALHHKK